jgi:hypothetical protein
MAFGISGMTERQKPQSLLLFGAEELFKDKDMQRHKAGGSTSTCDFGGVITTLRSCADAVDGRR